ncbi:alpha/beta hydrolase [Acinetobacter lanii]|uniref:Alpha/beta hydrolase n=2 Tax=Acinetobacter lanii TaxID=2715163 RepID=A0A6G8S527_9GAMM|nr:alpha/beta hydrolase [Acinetobacter lanii]
MKQTNTKIMLALFAVLPLFVSGCQVVSVKNQKLNVTIANERDSILTRKKMSEASLNVLSMTGKEGEKCAEEPEKCISEIQDIPQIQDEQLYSAASEIYLTKALTLGNSSACAVSRIARFQSEEKQLNNRQSFESCLDEQLIYLDKSIRYSYAYLFVTKRHPSDRIFDNRQVQIRDFYNQAIAKLVTNYGLRYDRERVPKAIKVGQSTYHVNYDHYSQIAGKRLESLLSSYILNFSGFRSINRRDGFGSEFVATLPPEKTRKNFKYIVDPINHQYPNGINPNIHDPRYLAVTITAQPKSGNTVDAILNSPDFQLNIFDPYANDRVEVAGHAYPLAANFSAPYGLWLAENNLGASAYLSLIDRDNSITMPQLFKLEPYNPNKKVIVLVHGLASSPEAWIRLTNDIMGDSVLREHYQVWQVFYSTNMPILESHYQINALVRQTFQQLDPKANAAKDAVLIGHSMGGIIARLMVSNADVSEKANTVLKTQDIKKLTQEPLFKQRLVIQPIDNFSRAIFLSSPHRGTEYAERWFTLALRKIIKLPGAFIGAFAETLMEQDIKMHDFMRNIDHGLIQNGPSDLSDRSKFTKLTEDIVPPKGFVFHSILGNLSKSNDKSQINDGVVAYESAHLDGAASETILKGGHSIQETPEAVLELRRILKLHLKEHGITQ